MQFNIRNIGLVAEADIKVDGLTVIAGQNGIGKSYIGKAIYSAVKTPSPKIKEIKYSDTDKNKVFFARIYREIELIGNTELLEYIRLKNYFERGIMKGEDVILELINELTERFPDIVENKDIIKIIEKYKNKQDYRLEYIYDFFISYVFHAEYSSKFLSKKSTITITKKGGSLLQIEVDNNKTKEFNLHSHLPYKDIILLETPLILQQVTYIRDNLAFNNNSRKLLPYYTIDLVQKIVEAGYEAPKDNSFYESIKKTIDGLLTWQNDKIVYKDKNDNAYNIHNVASGIKSFGLIQLLLAGGSINPETILIIDEPEVHLHPEWQLEYAKLLIELVKHNIPVVVASHSPYFVEALKVYSDNAGIADKTNFYLGEMKEEKGGSVFEDVTHDLDKLFEKFARPMIQLSIDR